MKEQEIRIPVVKGHKSLLHCFAHFLCDEKKVDGFPVRFAVTKTDDEFYHCEIGTLLNYPTCDEKSAESIFRFTKRTVENTDDFNAVLIIPTGIGSEIAWRARHGC